MSQAVITLAFEQWKAQQAATDEAVTLDEFVFAYVPDLDVDAPIDREEAMPPVSQIVHRQAVSRKGVVNDNAVVHSVVLGADTGDFRFNWVGLINKTSGTLAMIVHAPEQQKLKTKDGQQGNVLTRSFLMEFNGAQTETGIDTPAETWQIDFTARMTGIDERQRLENVDIYGAGAFFDDGYLVAKTGTQYFVTKGTGYVAGLRAVLAANQNIAVAAKPVKVWLDVCWTGTLTSAWNVQQKITVAATHANYVLDSVQHYVFALASIDANGNITDLRPKGSLGEQHGNSNFLRKDANLADLTNKASARNQLELKGGALKDVVSSAKDITADRLVTVGWMGLGASVQPVNDNIDFAQIAPTGFIYGQNNGPTSGVYFGFNARHSNAYQFTFVGRNNKYFAQTWEAGSAQGWSEFYTTSNKPSAADVGALSSGGGTITGALNINANVPCIFLKSTGADSRRYIMSFDSDNSASWYVGKANLGSESCILWNYTANSGIEINPDTKMIGINNNGKTALFKSDGTFTPASWTNFDERYQAKGSYAAAGASYTKTESDNRYYTKAQSDDGYMPKVSAYTKTESDARYQLKNTAGKAANGWFKDTSTGMITQWGTANGGNDDQYYTVNTPIAFPTAFVSLQVYPIYPGAVTSGHTLASAGKINSTSQFGYGISDGSSGSINAQGVYWIAIGF